MLHCENDGDPYVPKALGARARSECMVGAHARGWRARVRGRSAWLAPMRGVGARARARSECVVGAHAQGWRAQLARRPPAQAWSRLRNLRTVGRPRPKCVVGWRSRRAQLARPPPVQARSRLRNLRTVAGALAKCMVGVPCTHTHTHPYSFLCVLRNLCFLSPLSRYIGLSSKHSMFSMIFQNRLNSYVLKPFFFDASL